MSEIYSPLTKIETATGSELVQDFSNALRLYPVAPLGEFSWQHDHYYEVQRLLEVSVEKIGRKLQTTIIKTYYNNRGPAAHQVGNL